MKFLQNLERFQLLRMSADDFQLKDDGTADNSIIKRDFARSLHQQNATLNKADKNIEFNFG